MSKVEKEVQRYVFEYSNNRGSFFKVVMSDGRGGQIRKQGFISKIDAIEYAVKKYGEILTSRGTRIVNNQIRFHDYAKSWLLDKGNSGLRESTIDRYNDELRLRLIPYFGHYKLVDLEKIHLRNFIADFQRAGVKMSAIVPAVGLFKSIIRQAESDDLIPYRGISQIPTPRYKQKEPKFWDRDQIHQFLEATKNHKYHALWKLTLFTGMRAGEISGLKWDAVHLDKTLGGHTGFIEVKRIYNQNSEKMEETTKNGSERLIPLLPEAYEALSLLQKLPNKGEFVFGGNRNLNSRHFSYQLKVAIKRNTDLPVINFHGLRHSCCSLLDSSGMSRRVVSEILGHKTAAVTERYSHVSKQVLGDEVLRWIKMQSQQKTNNFNPFELITSDITTAYEIVGVKE